MELVIGRWCHLLMCLVFVVEISSHLILCFQFPAIVNVDVDIQSTPLETPFQDEVKRNPAGSLNSKNRSTSVNKVNSSQTNTNDSSDTDVYSDNDDDDDDIIIVQEERRSLFSALKSRMSDKESGKRHSVQSKRPNVIAVEETSGECMKKVSENKRTSAIVDLSFSDDDESQEDCQFKLNSMIQSFATKTQTTNHNDCDLVETQQQQQSEKAGPSHKNMNVRKKSSQKIDRKLMELSPSKHDTDSCEDSDDLPCVLPLSLYSGSERNGHSCKSFPSSCTDNYKSSDSSAQESNNMDSQRGSEVPAKRKKRSPEEITRQRNEALVSITFSGLQVYSHRGIFVIV